MIARSGSSGRIAQAVRWTCIIATLASVCFISRGNLLSVCYLPLLALAPTALVALSALAAGGLTATVLVAGIALPPEYLGVVQGFRDLVLSVSQMALAGAFALAGKLVDRGHVEAVHRYSGVIRAALLTAAVFLVIAMAFRPVPLWPTAAWVVVLGCQARAVRRQISAPSRPLRRRLVRLIVALAVVAAFFGLAELTTRLAFRGTRFASALSEPRPTAPHPTRIFTIRPGITFTKYFMASPTDIRSRPIEISSLGLRDRHEPVKAENEYRILMLGDSFTMGLTLPPEETIPGVLEGKLRSVHSEKSITVINAGMAGYGPWQERDLLNEVGFGLSPDLVMLQVYPENDLDNTLTKIGTRFRAYNRVWHQGLLDVQHASLWQVRLKWWLEGHVALYHAVKQLNLFSAHPVDWWNNLRLVAPCDYPELPPNEPRSFSLEPELVEYYPELDEAMNLMIDDIAGICADCRARHVECLVFCVPQAQVAVPRLWTEAQTNAPPGVAYERFKSVRLTHERLVQRCIPYVDVPAYLAGREDVDNLYWVADGHLTAKGNEVVAECLVQYLLSDLFPRIGLTSR
ncbi:MAG TPA: hypothetical protein PLO37_15750 [Candidatus Hydrogenedentes bacterium]|nr:hypothetical protein [Candidatus Hydrogenedentota bacterium]HPG68301.1 hypothetical protein [Candidatus Hydrogenedentota bacterium]